MAQTIFEKIIAREVPAEILYEDAKTIAILDIAPNNPGHALVISKDVYTNIFDVPEDVWLSMMKTVHKLAPAIQRGVGAEGINVKMNNGEVAGQEVPHIHVHIIPRYADDGYTHWSAKVYGEGEAARVADAIRTTLTT